MINYLYYKLYRATLKGSLHDVAEIAVPAYMGCLFTVNIIVFNAFLSKIFNVHYFFTNVKVAIILCVVLIILIKVFYPKRKVQLIKERYSNENGHRGTLIVWLYVLLSFLSIFAIAFFKPGQLNT
jgi:hypothetical protein